MNIAVIGGGVGGYTAAIRAAQLGAQVTLFEDRVLGGTCLNRGCIPTKALVRCASLFRDIQRSDDFGITLDSPAADYGAMVRRNHDIIKKLRGGIEQLIRANKITYVASRATLVTPTTVTAAAATESLSFQVDRIIIATGSEPAPLPGFTVDGVRILNTDQVLELSDLPASVAILGAGTIAVEFAGILQCLGSQVTVIARSSVLRKEDPRVARHLARSLSNLGVELIEGASVSVSQIHEDAVALELSTGDRVEADRLLIAVGRKANTSGFGLDKLGVRLKDDFIDVDHFLQTNVAGIYAVGDVIGEPLLAHVAAAEAKTAAANCMGERRAMDYTVVPHCIFTIPEAATIGLTEEQATQRGISCKSSRFSYSALGKALADGDAEGFVQIVFEATTDRVLGAQIVGAHASDIIHEIAVAMTAGLSVAAMSEMMHQHPSYSEAIMETVEAAQGLSIHSIRT